MSATFPAGSQPEPVAIMIGDLGQGGSERQLYLFLANCDRARWDPRVYVSGQLGIWADRIRALGIPVELLTGGRVVKMRRLRSACAAQGATCFFSWSSYTNPFGLALLGLGVRRVGSFRNALFSDLPARLRAVWSWASLSAISVAVCNSRETFEQIARRNPAWLTLVHVPNAVEAPSDSQRAEWRRAWRTRLGLDDDAVLVLGVGRITHQKRFDRFIDAVARVRTEHPVHAVIVGEDHGQRAELERRADRHGLGPALRFLGVVPDAREPICAADVFLLSSDHEGMPNVVLEAMSTGVPCVVTRVNAMADLIENGETGFIAERDAEALALRVAYLAGDPELRRRVGGRARGVVMRGQNARAVADRLWALCERDQEPSPP